MRQNGQATVQGPAGNSPASADEAIAHHLQMMQQQKQQLALGQQQEARVGQESGMLPDQRPSYQQFIKSGQQNNVSGADLKQPDPRGGLSGVAGDAVSSLRAGTYEAGRVLSKFGNNIQRGAAELTGNTENAALQSSQIAQNERDKAVGERIFPDNSVARTVGGLLPQAGLLAGAIASAPVSIPGIAATTAATGAASGILNRPSTQDTLDPKLVGRDAALGAAVGAATGGAGKVLARVAEKPFTAARDKLVPVLSKIVNKPLSRTGTDKLHIELKNISSESDDAVNKMFETLKQTASKGDTLPAKSVVDTLTKAPKQLRSRLGLPSNSRITNSNLSPKVISALRQKVAKVRSQEFSKTSPDFEIIDSTNRLLTRIDNTIAKSPRLKESYDDALSALKQAKINRDIADLAYKSQNSVNEFDLRKFVSGPLNKLVGPANTKTTRPYKALLNSLSNEHKQELQATYDSIQPLLRKLSVGSDTSLGRAFIPSTLRSQIARPGFERVNRSGLLNLGTGAGAVAGGNIGNTIEEQR